KAVGSHRLLRSVMVLIVLLLIAVLGFVFLSGGASEADSDDENPAPVNVTADGSLELYYDDAALTVRNPGTHILVLSELELRQNNSVFAFEDFGRSSLQNWLPGMCAYVAQLHTDYKASADCPPQNTRSPLLYSSSDSFVWLDNFEKFDVYQGNERLGTCSRAEQSCIIQGVKRVSDS
ncbi:MAG TPA: hypothetical protein VJZ27_14000, partial [Aggregatilineales bacterium]|nr:hypothetical protein [Aggregatilineales bacterium]